MKGKILSRNREVSLGNIRRAIILCFFLAALLAFVLVGGINFFLAERRNDAKIVNLAGRQRMLSQKIAKNIYVLQKDASLYEAIKKDTELWASMQDLLRYGDEGSGIPRPNDPEIDSLFDVISPYQKNLLGLTQSKNVGKLNEIQIAQLWEWESKFLAGMDRLVNAFQKASEKRINDLKYAIAFLVTLYVLFLFVLYKIFVKPLFVMVQALSNEKERQVRKSRSILENTSDLIWSVDREYRLLAFNSAFSESIMRKRGTVPDLGENILMTEHLKLGLSKRKRLYDRALSGESFEKEFEVVRQGRNIHYELSFHPIYGKNGEVSGCSVFRRDITRRVETYKELQEREKYLKEAQEIANCGHWNWDMTKNKIQWSDQLYKVFGQDAKTFEANYESLMDIIHPDDRRAFNDDVENCIENNETHDIVHRILMKDGSIRYVHQKGRPYYDNQGNPVRMTGTTQDVTAMELAKNRILKQYNELQNFVYIISHNLRSPIANLQALVDIIEPGNEELNAEILSNISTTTEALDRTVRDLNHALSLKDVSEDTFEEVDLETILRDVELLLARETTQNGAEIEYDLSLAPKAVGLKSYFTNILFNLLLNAISYKSQKRTPHIKIVSLPTVTGGVQIKVRDNGKGMELNQEKRKKIFDMYGRLSGSTKGRGLGLYLVKTQVETMKGSIKVESEPGKGSVFILEFAGPKADTTVPMEIV